LTLPVLSGTSEKGEESSGRKASCPDPASRRPEPETVVATLTRRKLPPTNLYGLFNGNLLRWLIHPNPLADLLQT
jgi:hypothetical protein